VKWSSLPPRSAKATGEPVHTCGLVCVSVCVRLCMCSSPYTDQPRLQCVCVRVCVCLCVYVRFSLYPSHGYGL